MSPADTFSPIQPGAYAATKAVQGLEDLRGELASLSGAEPADADALTLAIDRAAAYVELAASWAERHPTGDHPHAEDWAHVFTEAQDVHAAALAKWSDFDGDLGGPTAGGRERERRPPQTPDQLAKRPAEAQHCRTFAEHVERETTFASFAKAEERLDLYAEGAEVSGLAIRKGAQRFLTARGETVTPETIAALAHKHRETAEEALRIAEREGRL